MPIYHIIYKNKAIRVYENINGNTFYRVPPEITHRKCSTLKIAKQEIDKWLNRENKKLQESLKWQPEN